jgi:hypothetical protein
MLARSFYPPCPEGSLSFDLIGRDVLGWPVGKVKSANNHQQIGGNIAQRRRGHAQIFKMLEVSNAFLSQGRSAMEGNYYRSGV